MKRSIGLVGPLALVIVFGARPAAGAPPTPPASPDPTTVSAARALGEEGLALFDAARYAPALERFESADALIHAPTLGLMAARCLAKLGRLVEASERYVAVTRAELGPGASDAFKEAQADAESERAALLPRIPKLEITLAAAAGAAVTLDDKPLGAALIGVKLPVDPGSHTLEAKQGGAVDRQRITLREGETKAITLRPLLAGPPSAPGRPVRWTLGWVGVGVGAAGVIAGAVTGGMASGAKGDLDAKGCSGGVCDPSLRDDVSRYNGLRTISTAGFVVGAVGLAAGLTLVLTAPRPPGKAAAARWQTWIGPAGLGVEEVF
jgi:hypothetical protein